MKQLWIAHKEKKNDWCFNTVKERIDSKSVKVSWYTKHAYRICNRSVCNVTVALEDCALQRSRNVLSVGILRWIRTNLTGEIPKSILRVARGIFMQPQWSVTSIAFRISDSCKRQRRIPIYLLYSCYDFSRRALRLFYRTRGDTIGFNDIAEAAKRRGAFLCHEASFFLSWLYIDGLAEKYLPVLLSAQTAAAPISFFLINHCQTREFLSSCNKALVRNKIRKLLHLLETSEKLILFVRWDPRN